ncbi:TPA: hypothetical protein IU311_001806 [Enterococcus faecalis]|uniref:Uncharacterized protein n=2 Tax=Enterococcus faecalis TaxID=1351 RepID=A0ABD7XS94_ENTFL|nr:MULTISPECIES: hypothetical protein [Enterococcus]EKX6153065.1 hypothetical protein [Pseudomonas aeruginosa]MBU5553845.1 hypothetical protein [Enterococcus sp. S157_ASV_20]MBU5559332.1 hypothetical protein [Enterococcus sp. S115_ASV_20]MBU5576906.1 hypothetical protein [Enterococcus sp. S131_ASV_20]CPW57354.1 Uncharacterised protein [Mycobacteroides abscessus]
MLVHNKGKFIRHIGDVRLIPGMNELSSSDIEAFTKGMEVPLNKALENQGEIEILDQPQKGKTKNSVGFSELAANKAVESIADTFDLELLEKWLEEEQANKNRTTVVKAIENQIDDIKNPDEDSVVNPE